MSVSARRTPAPAKKKTTAKKAATRRVAKKVAPKTKASPKARSLAGGNPQIAKADGNAPVQAFIAGLDGWKRELAKKIDALIVRTVPKAQKKVRWNTPFYGIEGQGSFLGMHAMTGYIKVAFFRGTSLEPLPPGASKQKGMRFLDLHEGELDEKQLASWVKQAAKLPGWRL